MGIGFELSGLKKSFAGKAALDDVSCSFPAGMISAVIGPNGSGKTTLIRILAGLERPDGGEVACTGGGERLPWGPALMRRATLVAQRPTLFRMPLRKNIEYGLRARGLPAGAVKARAEEALKAGGLSALAGSCGHTLSGGEAQRAALVRAWALMPEAALLDEPTASLDPDGVTLAEGLIRRMKDDYGATVVLVTHNLFQAKRLADRVFFLMGGRLVEEGTAREMFLGPKDPLTKRYVSGEMVY